MFKRLLFRWAVLAIFSGLPVCEVALAAEVRIFSMQRWVVSLAHLNGKEASDASEADPVLGFWEGTATANLIDLFNNLRFRAEHAGYITDSLMSAGTHIFAHTGGYDTDRRGISQGIYRVEFSVRGGPISLPIYLSLSVRGEGGPYYLRAKSSFELFRQGQFSFLPIKRELTRLGEHVEVLDVTFDDGHYYLVVYSEIRAPRPRSSYLVVEGIEAHVNYFTAWPEGTVVSYQSPGPHSTRYELFGSGPSLADALEDYFDQLRSIERDCYDVIGGQIAGPFDYDERERVVGDETIWIVHGFWECRP